MIMIDAIASKTMIRHQLPNFLIVGAAKSGTTSLYRYLRQHPDVFMPRAIKETFYFSDLPPCNGPGAHYGERAISSWEAYRTLFSEGMGHAARGEACVSYLFFYEQAVPRIMDRLGADTKIIISLRDPIERAYSNYLHHVRDGLEPLAFDDALAAAQKRQAAGWWWGFQYMAVGCYFEQVRAYLNAFGRDGVCVMCFEEWTRELPEATQRLFDFLDVDSSFIPDTSVQYNATGVPRSSFSHVVMTSESAVRDIAKRLLPRGIRESFKNWYFEKGLARPPMNASVRQRLATAFKDDVRRLEDLLQRDFSHWNLVDVRFHE